MLSKERIQFWISRFVVVRKAYSRYRSVRDGYRPHGSVVDSGIFGALDPAAIRRSLQSDAVWNGLRVPARLVEEIRDFSSGTLLEARLKGRAGRQFMRLEQIRRGRTSGGDAVPIAYVSAPDDCDAVQRIRNDPALTQVLADFLGYVPRSIITRLYWSFAVDATASERVEAGQTFEFHYDVNGFNFVYVSFYLTDTDASNGAHVMIKGSNKTKPWRMLFPSVRASDEAVYRQYGRESELLISGTAGTGFIQDASCYHKALIPVRGERLMLQLRYS